MEERAKQDKENLRRERQNLFNKRKAEQAHMRAIQHKMELVEIVSITDCQHPVTHPCRNVHIVARCCT